MPRRGPEPAGEGRGAPPHRSSGDVGGVLRAEQLELCGHPVGQAPVGAGLVPTGAERRVLLAAEAQRPRYPPAFDGSGWTAWMTTWSSDEVEMSCENLSTWPGWWDRSPRPGRTPRRPGRRGSPNASPAIHTPR